MTSFRYRVTAAPESTASPTKRRPNPPPERAGATGAWLTTSGRTLPKAAGVGANDGRGAGAMDSGAVYVGAGAAYAGAAYAGAGATGRGAGAAYAGAGATGRGAGAAYAGAGAGPTERGAGRVGVGLTERWAVWVGAGPTD